MNFRINTMERNEVETLCNENKLQALLDQDNLIEMFDNKKIKKYKSKDGKLPENKFTDMLFEEF